MGLDTVFFALVPVACVIAQVIGEQDIRIAPALILFAVMTFGAGFFCALTLSW